MLIKKILLFLVLSIGIILAVTAVEEIAHAGFSHPTVFGPAPTPFITPSATSIASTVTTTAPTGSVPAVTPTPSKTTDSGNTLIHTVQITINGSVETVLTNALGYTFYYRTSDTDTSVCSGKCAETWVPFLNSGYPTSSVALPGTLSIMSNANGQQVAYDGHPLYTYTGDKKPADSQGQGIEQVWFVVPISL